MIAHQIESAPRPQLTPVKPGYYTIVMPEVEGHITFRVEVQANDARFAPGEMIISRLVGPDNTSNYKGVAFARKYGGGYNVWSKHREDKKLRAALDILAGDPKAAAEGYAKKSGRCYRCNRLLTEPLSIDLGIGPECRKKGGW